MASLDLSECSQGTTSAKRVSMEIALSPEVKGMNKEWYAGGSLDTKSTLGSSSQ